VAEIETRLLRLLFRDLDCEVWLLKHISYNTTVAHAKHFFNAVFSEDISRNINCYSTQCQVHDSCQLYTVVSIDGRIMAPSGGAVQQVPEFSGASSI